MLDVGAGEFLVLAIAALLIFGPDRLPTMARQAGRWVRDLRTMVANARHDLKEHTGFDTDDLQLSDLNPRTFVRKHVLDGVDLDLGLDDDPAPKRAKTNGARQRPRNANAGAGADPAPASPPPYDPDAT